LCLLNPAVLVVSGLSEVLGALGQILLSYLVHMHNRLRSLIQGPNNLGGSATCGGFPMCTLLLLVILFNSRTIRSTNNGVLGSDTTCRI
jgi:hypothetical protein